VALTKAVGPEEVALLALRVARNHLDGASAPRPPLAAARRTVAGKTNSRVEWRA
jgi:hypothetical protein